MVLDGEDGAVLDGCQLGLVTASTRGGADIAGGLEWRGPVDLALTTASAGLRRCTGGLNSRIVAHINDAHISRGVSTVGAGKFGVGGTTAVAATHEQLSSARMMTGNLPVVPTRASLSASGRAAAPSTIHSGASQHFYGTQSTSRPESFQQQTAHLQQSMQQSHFSPVTAGRSSGGLESRACIVFGCSGREAERGDGCRRVGKRIILSAGVHRSRHRRREANRTAASGKLLRRRRTVMSRWGAAEAARRRRAEARVEVIGIERLRVPATRMAVRAAMAAGRVFASAAEYETADRAAAVVGRIWLRRIRGLSRFAKFWRVAWRSEFRGRSCWRWGWRTFRRRRSPVDSATIRRS